MLNLLSPDRYWSEILSAKLFGDVDHGQPILAACEIEPSTGARRRPDLEPREE